jgi:outer membrane protein, multidrug efflux system
MNRHAFTLLLGMSIVMGGCTMAPEYSRPEAPVPADWPSGAAYSATRPATAPSDVMRLTWQEFFSDVKLQYVIEMALQNNRDLRLAALNVERAHALYDVQRAEWLPVLDASASYTRQKVPANIAGLPSPQYTFSHYGGNVFVSAWEIDFFGRIRSLVDQALEQYLASEQARRSVQILLVSEVANAYLTLAADRDTLKLAKTTLDTQQAAYDLVKRRLDRGYVPELDLYRAQTQVDTAKVDAARYTQIVAQDENELNLLAGAPVPEELLPAELSGISPPKQISPGVSSHVLLCRPDVLQAEDLLKAANANIGAARAAFFPRISLTTSLGTGSAALSDLFKSGSGAWSFAPQIVVPIFDSRTWSALKVTEVDKQSAIAQYEKVIQTAFREVANALAVRGTVDQQISAQESLVHAAEETYRLSTARYIKGVDGYLSVLDAQQSLYSAQRNLVFLHLERLANQVQLYAVLGGGWQSESAMHASR